VTIAKGVDDNELIVLRDKGNVINENCKGDIKLFVKVENNTPFIRSGMDLILDKEITLKDALCGFSFEIKYINGKSYTLHNNSGNIISPGFKKIIPNLGLERDDHKGNMIIIFNVKFPEKLTEEQMCKLREVL
jgi:DnaJ family protein A protein 2